jgi:hypothetical protein
MASSAAIDSWPSGKLGAIEPAPAPISANANK